MAEDLTNDVAESEELERMAKAQEHDPDDDGDIVEVEY